MYVLYNKVLISSFVSLFTLLNYYIFLPVRFFPKLLSRRKEFWAYWLWVSNPLRVRETFEGFAWQRPRQEVKGHAMDEVLRTMKQCMEGHVVGKFVTARGGQKPHKGF